MPRILLNLDALAHNAEQTRALARLWNVDVLPVLKAVASHPASMEVLRGHGFTRFGFAERAEPILFDGGPDVERVLIQLCPLSQAGLVVERFARSFQSTPEALSSLDAAAAALGRRHEVLLMVDLGDGREGLGIDEVADVLDRARRFRSIRIAGFGATLACLGARGPDADVIRDMSRLKDLFAGKGVADPVVSAGGSIFCHWLDAHGAGPITEVRLGDPFLLGEDIYLRRELPGGPFRRDVCMITAEVLEVRTRMMSPTPRPILHHADGQESPLPSAPALGRRVRALLDIGRFHTEAGDLACILPGAEIVGLSSGYMVLDVTNCREPVDVGQEILFHPGYWAMARAFRTQSVTIAAIRDSDLPPQLQHGYIPPCRHVS